MSAVGKGDTSPLVLVVDDEPSVRATLSLCLRAAGYQTICAEDGRAAQQLIHDFSPSAIVADIFMPVQDGLGLMNWLREQGIKIPVVAISGHGRSVDFDGLGMARRLGASSILEKPFPAGALAAAVDSALDAVAYA
ncbi:response regulator [Dongia sp.]|uniref:response regulator n=1 Tax=Dongia sp. TaxID=1977262 RepID=UPI0037516AA7